MGIGFAEWYSWSSARDERLAALFYRHVDLADIEGRDPEAIVGPVTHLIDVARDRDPEQAVVRAVNPTADDDGWTCGRTVVSIVTDDMPFLVDSVSAELNRLGVGIHIVVHPIVAVTRNDVGRLVSAEPPMLARSTLRSLCSTQPRRRDCSSAIRSSIRCRCP